MIKTALFIISKIETPPKFWNNLNVFMTHLIMKLLYIYTSYSAINWIEWLTDTTTYLNLKGMVDEKIPVSKGCLLYHLISMTFQKDKTLVAMNGSRIFRS